MSDDTLVLVHSTRSVPEGEIARARLEAEDIPVLVKGEGEGPYRMGPVELWVPARYEVQARLVLEADEAPISDDELAALAETTPTEEASRWDPEE